MSLTFGICRVTCGDYEESTNDGRRFVYSDDAVDVSILAGAVVLIMFSECDDCVFILDLCVPVGIYLRK